MYPKFKKSFKLKKLKSFTRTKAINNANIDDKTS